VFRSLITVLILLLQITPVILSTAQAQITRPVAATGTQAMDEWSTPDLLNLPPDWLSRLETIELDVGRIQRRLDQFVILAKERIQGLDAQNSVEAGAALVSLQNNAASLLAAKQEVPETRQLAIPSQDSNQKVTGFKLFYIGDTPVTPASLVKFVLIVAFGFLLSWLIRRLLLHIQRRREQIAESSSFYTLGRILHYLIMTIAVLAAFTSLGLDTGSLALIAGALSVGIGFGLQSIVSNFLSGLILLFEGSLRVGDFIELESGVTGVVKEISTRYTRINTNDNVDVVVPNSELVSYKLTNWTLREPVIRIRIPFGVAYGTDKELVRKAALEAADEVPFTIKAMPDRTPDVLLINFGDSSLDFELRVWVSHQGVHRPVWGKAAYYWALETKFREYGIQIPFPQRDLHMREKPAQE
jgi:small-conductance mechanosensitive channel